MLLAVQLGAQFRRCLLTADGNGNLPFSILSIPNRKMPAASDDNGKLSGVFWNFVCGHFNEQDKRSLNRSKL